MLEYTVCEYGPDIVLGMPDGQKTKMRNFLFENITIVEEDAPMGTQKLKADDIIEELEKIPKNIRKYIRSVVLSPYTYPCPKYFAGENEKEELILASGDYVNRQITIYALPQDRSVLKEGLANNFTLAHETGHIVDRAIDPKRGFFAYTLQWSKAICEDSKIKRNKSDLPSYLVSPYAEHKQSIREDFADSFMFFLDKGRREVFLKENYPHRYKILEELFDRI
jgi:hypothetical protein